MGKFPLLARPWRLATAAAAAIQHSGRELHQRATAIAMASTTARQGSLPCSQPWNCSWRFVTDRQQARLAIVTSRGLHTSASASFLNTSPLPVNAVRKAAAREKARSRAQRASERSSRRREKEGFAPRAQSSPSSPAFQGSNGEKLTLAEQEKVLRRELASLSRQLEQIEKKETADEATKDLPPLDDQTLDELYQALMTPPPATLEDQRLARLESGRKHRFLARTGVPSIDDPKQRDRLEAQARMKQRLLDARDRGRALVPSRRLPMHLEKLQEASAERGHEDEVDLSRLTHAERREVRLQHLFERLTLLPSFSGREPSDSGKQQSLQEIRSGLASRIAKILESHDYLLRPPAESDPIKINSLGGSDGDETESAIPEYKGIELDRRITTHSADLARATSPTLAGSSGATSQVQYLDAANEIMRDVASATARGLMLDRMESLLDQSATTPQNSRAGKGQAPSLPLGIATIEEWTALAVSCAGADDNEGLARTLKLMRRSGYFPPPLSLLNDVMDVYATRGQVDRCQEVLSLLSRFSLEPDLHTYHCLTKAYLTNGQYAEAIKVLNSLESGEADLPPASMATYTMAIDQMMEDAREEIQALGWNLFYHMRLVAHPVPDAPLYALMIRACAKGCIQPQDVDDPSRTPIGPSGVITSQRADAERALDLFREMTTRYSVRPNAEVYNNLILACARRKDFYLEAFRLLREMVELETERVDMLSNQPVEGPERARLEASYLRFAPDRYTFNALLQGCARNKDLPRARWMLAEMIRATSPLFEGKDGGTASSLTQTQRMDLTAQRPSSETLSHVFWAYASFDPPISMTKMMKMRTKAKGVERNDSKTQDDATALSTSGPGQSLPARVNAGSHPTTNEASTVPASDEEAALSPIEAAQVFTHLVPQTSPDVVSEARALMARILADQPQIIDGKRIEGSLGSVEPSTTLLNAYLAALSNHLPVPLRLDTLWRSLQPVSDTDLHIEHGIFDRLGLEPNAHTHLLLLETASRLKSDPSIDEIVEQVWVRYRALDNVTDWRVVERCWCEKIRYSAKANQLEDALRTLKQFHTLYPPSSPPLSQAEEKKRRMAVARARRDPDGESRADVVPPPTASAPGAHALRKELDLSPMPIAVKSLQTLANPAASAQLQVPNHDDGLSEATASVNSGGGADAPGPLLTFVDLELLHHRLVRFQHKKGLAYVGWLARAYENMFRARTHRDKAT